MATKTRSKTATRKTAPRAFGAGRKTTAPQKPADVAPKDKVPKKGLEAPAKATAPAKQPKKPEGSAHTTPHAETVSLIDRKRPPKKSQDGEGKRKRTVLPAIWRIRASLVAASKPTLPAASATRSAIEPA